MNTGTARTLPRRTPQQDRSVHRVNTILDVARNLIGQHGASGLKMTEIAKQAGIPIGSLYQYFPEKAAIIKALYDSTSSEVEEKVKAAFATIASREDAIAIAQNIVDWYYEEFRRNPLHVEIWLGVETDKELLHLNNQESLRASRIFCEAVAPYSQDLNIDIEARALVMTHVTASAVRLAIFQTDEKMARRLLNEWKAIIRRTLFAEAD